MFKRISNIVLILSKGKNRLLFTGIFILLIFLRFYEIESRNSFGWDQVNNAWAAKNIIVNNEFPLLGFQAKLNSGLYIGPYYYYIISIVYFFTNLDPVASGIMAGITSIFTFLTIYFISKKLFSVNVALFAVFINTVSVFGINFDRVQGPINFIPSISLIIFFSLYKIITGNPKFLLLLFFAAGFSLHIHITSIYFFPIILLAIPFFPRNKELIKYSMLGIPIILFFIFPTVLAFLQNSSHSANALNYSNSYFHGLHLRRVMQLAGDSLIQFEPYFNFSNFKYLKFVLIPLFILLFLYKNMSKKRLLFCYLVILWFVIPWLTLSTYSGEISDYYYSTNRFIALFVIAYLLSRLFVVKNVIFKASVVIILIFYSIFNLNNFWIEKKDGIAGVRQRVQAAIIEGEKIGFQEGNRDSYMYYYYMRKYKGVEVY